MLFSKQDERMFSIEVMVVVRILISECALVKKKKNRRAEHPIMLGGGGGGVSLLCVCV